MVNRLPCGPLLPSRNYKHLRKHQGGGQGGGGRLLRREGIVLEFPMRKKIIIGIGLVVIALIALSLWLRTNTTTISEEQVASIKVGMTLSEVEAILGCRPGNYTYRNDFLPINMSFYAKEQQDNKALFREWAADMPVPRYTDGNGPNRQDAIAVRVWFDEHGKVIDKCRMGYSYTFRQPSVWVHLKRFLPKW